MEINFPKLEEEILKFWRENKIFEKSFAQRKKAKDFVFYDGPPTANAKPGFHHVLSRGFKDIIPRYKTMRGFRVQRKAGWDTHGLPVELEIEKKLGLKAKKDIEKYGIARFNQKCRESVWEYKKEWEKLTERTGFWLDMENPYITYTTDYIETVWFILKEIHKRGLLYRDYKVVPYCPRCGTSLSSHEVALGYQTVKDLAVIVKFPITEQEFINKYCQGKPTSFLAWTTTPWSLPTTMALAIGAEYNYVVVRIGEEQIICVKERLDYIMSHLPESKGDELRSSSGTSSPERVKKNFNSFDFADARVYEIINEFKGRQMEHITYEHPFGEIYQEHEKVKGNPNVYKTHVTNYVSLEDGTGIVTINGAFGEIDMEASRKIGLPVIVNVNKDGLFSEEMGEFAGKAVKPKEDREKTDIEIIKYLANKNLNNKPLLFAKEKHEHSYPFCWRCNSPLLYYAKESWFINMQKVKGDLISNNQKINWFPEHLKEGRMGEWLREVKDWTLSRERYWGTPLPVWRCQKCKKLEVIGSLQDLLSQKFSTNNYYIFRHGHSLRQVKNLASSWPEKSKFPLTKEGKAEVLRQAKKLKDKNIDLIFSSDLLRTKQTAGIISKETGAKIIFDKRLREVNVGIFNGKDPKLFWAYVSKKENPYFEKVPEGECLNDVRERMYRFLEKIDEKHQGKNIVIVSHEFPLSALEKTLEGMEIKEFVDWRRRNRDKLIKTGAWRKIEFKKLPFNPETEIDLHRPYIDEVKFYCSDCEGRLERASEVIDCWFDSGSMPFAQGHWPFFGSEKGEETRSLLPPRFARERKAKSEKLTPPELFPADYISEGVDQTRGWFYTLLAISTLLGFGPAYKNVISLGHVLDEKGEKMSKSKGNVVDPWQMIEKYGADAVRWYFYTINQPGDSKLFAERDIDQTLKKFILTFWNCRLFFETYAQKREIPNSKFQTEPRQVGARGKMITKLSLPIPPPKNLLDRWIISKLNRLISETTQKMDDYDVTAAARAIENFVINDLSLWYVRRSRRRFQRPETEKELREASAVLGYVLLTLSKLTAPFIPFLSESIYRGLTPVKVKPTVHWEDWPEADNKLIDAGLEEKMVRVRELVNLGLRERARLSIKVRQPLRELAVKELADGLDDELIGLLKEEINVKNITLDANLQGQIKLDEAITAELREEGMIREIIRNIQEMRKKAGLKPADKIKVWTFGPNGLNEILAKNKNALQKEGKIKELFVSAAERGVVPLDLEKEFELDGQKLRLGLRKEKDSGVR